MAWLQTIILKISSPLVKLQAAELMKTWDIPTVTWEEYNTFNKSYKQQIKSLYFVHSVNTSQGGKVTLRMLVEDKKDTN